MCIYVYNNSSHDNIHLYVCVYVVCTCRHAVLLGTRGIQRDFQCGSASRCMKFIRTYTASIVVGIIHIVMYVGRYGPLVWYYSPSPVDVCHSKAPI